MTSFRIKDMHDGEYPQFFDTTRRLYKGLISRLDREGKQIRVETMIEDGEAVKKLTILKAVS